MTKRLLGVALAAMIGATAVSARALAQGTGGDGARPDLRSGQAGETDDNRGGVGVPERVEPLAEPRSGAPVSPSLGDVNRGISGYYRNRTGTTPPSGRGGGWSGGGRGSGGRW